MICSLNKEVFIRDKLIVCMNNLMELFLLQFKNFYYNSQKKELAMTIDSNNTLSSLAQAREKDLVKNLKAKTENRLDSTDKALREQTDKFEALFVKMLLDTSLKLDNPLYPKQAGSDIYNAMFKEQLSESLSGNFGYSELLFNYLKDRQKNS